MRALFLAGMILAATPALANPAPFTHAQRCHFFALAAMSMVGFRDQGKHWYYGMRMAAYRLSLDHIIPDEPVGDGAGLEAEYVTGVEPEIHQMALDIWIHKPAIHEDLAIGVAKQFCGWPRAGQMDEAAQ